MPHVRRSLIASNIGSLTAHPMPTSKPPKIDLDAARAFAATNLPGAQVNAKFGGASFFLAGNVFAFTRPKGLVLKLPQETIANLLTTRDGST